MLLTGETEVLGENPIPLPLCSPHISYSLVHDQTHISTLRGWLLTS